MPPVPPDQISVVFDSVRRVGEVSVLVHHDHAHAIVDREHAWLRRIVGHASPWPSAHTPKCLRFVQVDPIRNRHTNATEVIVVTEAFDLEMIC